ncbi:MAG: hypothetical protein HC769_27600, partial [Cyanobacteria bacterium CRU_2_1]|nr:hypothetical protein [Cyanobacteria bacterium CRU_2_1]
MPQTSQTSINSKQIEKFIEKGTKKVIAESGINLSTRSGNKELHHLIRKVANQPFSSLEAATRFGEELGQKIVELSQKLGKTNLDQGVIRQLILQKEIPAIPEFVETQDQSSAAPRSRDVTLKPSSQPAKEPQPATQSSAESGVAEEESTTEEPELPEESAPTSLVASTEDTEKLEAIEPDDSEEGEEGEDEEDEDDDETEDLIVDEVDDDDEDDDTDEDDEDSDDEDDDDETGDSIVDEVDEDD